MNIKPITEREWIGLTINEANQRAEMIGYTCRVVEQDGRSLMVDMDVKSNRLNLRLKNGIVTGLYTG